MDIQAVDTTNRRQVYEFLELPFRLYASQPNWVPPLSIDARRVLDRQRNPFFRHSAAEFFLVRDAGKTLGRLAVLDNRNYNQFNQERTAFFYLFECEDRLEAAQSLFEAAFDWARQRGLDHMVGPKGFSVLDGQGMLVRGFEHRPAFGLPYNPPYYPVLVEQCGFTTLRELVSGYLDETMQFPEKIHELAQSVARRRGLRVTRLQSRKDLRRLIPFFKDLYNASLYETIGNAPLTDEEAQAMGDQLLWFADPRLVKLVMKDDQPVGFLLGYPDISAALQRTRGRLFPFGWIDLLLELRRTKWINLNGAGMAEGYRGVGGTALLFSEMYRSVAEDTRYRFADLVQIGLENSNMQREMQNFGIIFCKMHRLYERAL